MTLQGEQRSLQIISNLGEPTSRRKRKRSTACIGTLATILDIIVDEALCICSKRMYKMLAARNFSFTRFLTDLWRVGESES